MEPNLALFLEMLIGACALVVAAVGGLGAWSHLRDRSVKRAIQANRRALEARAAGGPAFPSTREIEDWCEFRIGANFQVIQRCQEGDWMMLRVRTCEMTTPAWLREHESALRFCMGMRTDAASFVEVTGDETATIVFVLRPTGGLAR